MDISDIKIKNAIVHILDTGVGTVVYSDQELEYGSDFAEFLQGHILRVYESDEIKMCHFMEDSQVEGFIREVLEERKDFISMSRDICDILYAIMQSNPDIPSADVMIAYFEVHEIPNLAILKMNYKESFTHTTMAGDSGNVNGIIRYRSILPSNTQKLSEAAIVNLKDFVVRILEKKYEVNGKKQNYFSGDFLKCSTRMSQKAKLNTVERAVKEVQREFLDESEQFEEQMKTKSVIHQEIQEQGSISIPEVATRIFENNQAMHEKFKEKMEQYHIAEEEAIVPQNQNTLRKFEKQHLTTDTGIEIKIPMEQYNSTDNIEFITNEDGSISVLIKNIGHITAK